MQVFIACPKNMPLNEVNDYMDNIRQFFHSKEKEFVNLVDSSTEFTKSFPQVGGWDEWINHIAKGKNYTTQKPLFGAIVCVDEEMGRASAQIVERSLDIGKPVFFWDKSLSSMRAVVGVKTVDHTDWVNGWKLSLL